MLRYDWIKELAIMMYNIDTSVNIFDDIRIENENSFPELFDLQWTLNEFEYPTQSYVQSSLLDIELESPPKEMKHQIRNHDCMWSGRCTSHPNECGNAARSASNTRNNVTQDSEARKNLGCSSIVAVKPQSLTDRTHMTRVTSTIAQRKQTQNIPAGRSLLRQNHNQGKQAQPTKSNIDVPSMTTADFLENRDSSERPDTPLSLDEDLMVPIDLAACTMGSNRQRLNTTTHTEIINILKEHLEDENSSQIQIRNKLSQFLPVLCKDETMDDLYKDIQSFSDYEFDDEEDNSTINESDYDCGNTLQNALSPSSVISSSCSSSSSNSSSSSSNSSNSSSSNVNPNNSTTTYENTQSMHTDHSYTRSKSRVDVIGLGVQTPSDSGKSFRNITYF